MYPAPCLSTQLVYPVPGARLALGVLRRLTGLLQAGLLALGDPRVPGQEACPLQGRAALRVDQDQGAGNAQAQRAGLTADPAAGDPDDHVELVLSPERHERLLDELLVNLVREVVLERPAVDLELAGAGRDAHPGDGFLAAAGAERVAGDDRPARRRRRAALRVAGAGVAGLGGVLRDGRDFVRLDGLRLFGGLSHVCFLALS